MISHVLVAGVPARFHDPLREVLGRIAREDQGFRPIIVPFQREHAPIYSSGYIRKVVATLGRDVSACRAPQTCLVAYIDHEASELLREAVHRYALLAALDPLQGDELRQDRTAQAVNRIATDLRRAYKQFRNVVNAVGGEVDSGRRSRTPLLLPPRNFGSQHLCGLLRTLACGLVDAGSLQDAQRMISTAVQGFLNRHPMISMDGRKLAHSNGAALFKAPGNDLHGQQHARDDHPDECRLGARLRLGHCFHEKFHYDVIPARGRFGATLPSCHGTFEVPHGRAHVNIAPNDHVRGN